MPAQVNVNSYDGRTGNLQGTVQIAANVFGADIAANIQTHLNQIETWIAANPAGAVLTAAQTLWVAQTLAGLCRLLLGLTGTIGGAT